MYYGKHSKRGACQVLWQPGRGNDWVVEQVQKSLHRRRQRNEKQPSYVWKEASSRCEEFTMCRSNWGMRLENKAEVRK